MIWAVSLLDLDLCTHILTITITTKINLRVFEDLESSVKPVRVPLTNHVLYPLKEIRNVLPK